MLGIQIYYNKISTVTKDYTQFNVILMSYLC